MKSFARQSSIWMSHKEIFFNNDTYKIKSMLRIKLRFARSSIVLLHDLPCEI